MSDAPLAEITRIGNLLYGARWQSSLARAIGVSDRTVRRWVAGSRPVPADCLARTRDLLIEARVEQALAAIDDLARISGPVAEIHLAEPDDPSNPLALEITRRIGAALTARGIRAETVPVDPALVEPAERAKAAAAAKSDALIADAAEAARKSALPGESWEITDKRFGAELRARGVSGTFRVKVAKSKN